MRLFILGATGRTGKELTDLALKKGHSVTAFVRSPQKLAATGAGLRAVEGSPAEVERMAEAMQGHDAVFSALGPKPREVFTSLSKRSWTMEKFAANTIVAMEQAKVRRLVLFSSAGLFPGQTIVARFRRVIRLVRFGLILILILLRLVFLQLVELLVQVGLSFIVLLVLVVLAVLLVLVLRVLLVVLRRLTLFFDRRRKEHTAVVGHGILFLERLEKGQIFDTGGAVGGLDHGLGKAL